MQNITFKFGLWAVVLTVAGICTATADAKCPMLEDCECPAAMGRGEDCACPQVKNVTASQNNCAQASDQAAPVAYTLAPSGDEYQPSARRKLFKDSDIVDKRNSRDGSIFGGGPCVSCTKNGSIFGGGPCINCDKNGSIFGGAPCDGPACKPAKPNPKYIQNYVVFDDDIYNSVHHQCKDFAPLQLDWVDFRIQNGMNNTGYSRKLGNYRFRIFGCRRDSKNAILNEGRIMEKDMRFVEIFDDMVSDCYKTVSTPSDLCLRSDSPLPEYVLTAEITNYHMNLCDEYNWDESKKANERIGSSEMTVTWRLMDLTKTNVLWRGNSTGYAEVVDGEQNGEMILIERAFADAVDNLRNLPGFEDQLAQRVDASVLQKQREELIAMQQQMDPVKCQYSERVAVMENSGAVSGGYGMNEEWIDAEETQVVVVEDAGSTSGGSALIESTSTTVVAGDGSQIEEVVSTTKIEEIDDMSAMFEKDKLCIIERPDYSNMGPENVYKVRTAVVSVTNAKGKKGAGLLISEQFVMTSADLIDRNNNIYTMETINGKKLEGRAFRVNPKKNTALLVLNQNTEYTPLSLNLELPAVDKETYMTLSLLNFEAGEGEGYLGNGGKVSGYRYDADGTSQIVIDNFNQGTSLGSVLIDSKGRITGLAHTTRSGDGPDLFLPIETAMRSLGVEICGKAFPEQKPRPVEKTWRKQPVAPLIESTAPKAPEVMKAKERK